MLYLTQRYGLTPNEHYCVPVNLKSRSSNTKIKSFLSREVSCSYLAEYTLSTKEFSICFEKMRFLYWSEQTGENCFVNLSKQIGFRVFSVIVSDPHHFNADRVPAFHFDADPDPACHFEPTFYSDADPSFLLPSY
jgi:hypothetical protein